MLLRAESRAMKRTAPRLNSLLCMGFSDTSPIYHVSLSYSKCPFLLGCTPPGPTPCSILLPSLSCWPLCHLLRVPNLEHKSQASSRGTFFSHAMNLAPRTWFSFSFSDLYYHPHYASGPVPSQGCKNSQISNLKCFIPAPWVLHTHECTLHIPSFMGP